MSEVNRQKMQITTLYDNYKYVEKDLRIGWGFSCWIKINDKNILFDTGENPENLLFNMKKMRLDPKKIDFIVISHNHWDHTGGLKGILKIKPEIKVYKPNDFEKPTEITKDVYTTGALGTSIREQALVLKTKKGLVVLTGCAHPGIVEIMKSIRLKFKDNIHLVMGGFHLEDMSTERTKNIIDELKHLDIEYFAPSHCTGNKQINLFRNQLGDRFIENGAGKEFAFEER